MKILENSVKLFAQNNADRVIRSIINVSKDAEESVELLKVFVKEQNLIIENYAKPTNERQEVNKNNAQKD